MPLKLGQIFTLITIIRTQPKTYYLETKALDNVDIIHKSIQESLYSPDTFSLIHTDSDYLLHSGSLERLFGQRSD